MRNGTLIQLRQTGDPPPGHFVKQTDMSWEWGVGDRTIGVTMEEDQALKAVWLRFRSRALVPEAGAEVLGMFQLPSTGEAFISLLCKNRIAGCSGKVSYPQATIQKDWEIV